MATPFHISIEYREIKKDQAPKLFNQVHGNQIIEVHPYNYATLQAHPPQADGAYTLGSELALTVITADCIPLMFYSTDPTGPIGVVHSGWRGTLNRIASRMVETLSGLCPIDSLCVQIGPCLLDCCFEVKQDLIDAFKKEKHPIISYLSKRENKWYFDHLKMLIDTQLNSMPPTQIDLSLNTCTKCSTPPLPSYRRLGSTEVQLQGTITKHTP